MIHGVIEDVWKLFFSGKFNGMRTFCVTYVSLPEPNILIGILLIGSDLMKNNRTFGSRDLIVIAMDQTSLVL